MLFLLQLVLSGGGLLRLLFKMPWQVWLLLALAGAFFFVYHKGDIDGSARVQARWDQAAAQAVAQGQQIGSSANAAAEASVPQVAPNDPGRSAVVLPRLNPCRVFDANDRDCAGH